MDKSLISIVGPTAIGKTTKSIALAKAFQTEIISADSRQFYKEMTLGTAVPSEEELTQVPHHFIQHISIDDNYSAGDFEQEALVKLEQLFKDHTHVIMAGGSGLFADAVTKGLDEFPEVDPGIREHLNMKFKDSGLKPLQSQLKDLDPKYAESVDMKNPRRIIRALEVSLSSGKPYSSFLNQPKTERSFKTIKIGLRADRAIIYERIERRVDIMMNNGLLEEAQSLYPYRHKKALNTIGYKELYQHIEGNCSLDFAIQEIKKNTRRFAKRQLTWFRRDKTINWFPHDIPAHKITKFIRSKTT